MLYIASKFSIPHLPSSCRKFRNRLFSKSLDSTVRCLRSELLRIDSKYMRLKFQQPRDYFRFFSRHFNFFRFFSINPILPFHLSKNHQKILQNPVEMETTILSDWKLAETNSVSTKAALDRRLVDDRSRRGSTRKFVASRRCKGGGDPRSGNRSVDLYFPKERITVKQRNVGTLDNVIHRLYYLL